MFSSLSTGHSWIVLYKGALMNTCRRLLSCNVTPLPECFCRPILSLTKRAANTHTHTRTLLLWRVCPCCSVTGSNDSIWYIQGFVCAGGRGTVVQLCTNIKEHSSKVLTNTARSSLSLFLSIFSDFIKSAFFFFLETICWPQEQPEVLHEHFTFCLLGNFNFFFFFEWA